MEEDSRHIREEVTFKTALLGLRLMKNTMSLMTVERELL
jgi:hypothetical protein